jgi:hypothetical protein
MRKATKNYILFVIMLITSLLETVSGFVLWLALPCGDGGWQGGRGSVTAFWALSRDAWRGIHRGAAITLIAAVIIHLILHWRWIVYMTKSYFKPRPARSE